MVARKMQRKEKIGSEKRNDLGSSSEGAAEQLFKMGIVMLKTG